MNIALCGFEFHKTMIDWTQLRLQFPELMKRGQIMELGQSCGVSVHTLRKLLDGADATLQPVPLPGRRYYRRDVVFVHLGGPTVDSAAKSQPHIAP